MKYSSALRCNRFEARMAVGLSSYLLKQGQAAGQITILTPYTSQLRYVFILPASMLASPLFTCLS
jgi:hypothetical protein